MALCLAALIAGCATRPDCTAPVGDRGLTPASVLAGASGAGRVVSWGGRLVAVRNLASETELEVMGYPLDRCGRPLTGKASQGRFLVRYPGFLEPMSYAPGRLVTATGRVGGLTDGRVGEAQLILPVLEEAVARLWPGPADAGGEPWIRARPSIGIGIGGGGRHVGGGVSVYF